MKNVISSAYLFLFVSFLSTAQETPPREELITDRPDETEAPTLIRKRYLQVETGFYYKDFSGDELKDQVTGYNTTLFRYGLLDNLELRVKTDLIEREEEINGSEIDNRIGLKPLVLGVKIGIAEESGGWPEIGFLGHIYVPFVAAEEYRPETTGVDFRFAFSHDFSNSDLGYNIGAKWRKDSAEAVFIYTISYGYDVTERLGAFAELYGEMPEDGTADHFWDAGFTYDLRYNVQLDAFIGSGFNNEQIVYVGGGVSFRMPQ